MINQKKRQVILKQKAGTSEKFDIGLSTNNFPEIIYDRNQDKFFQKSDSSAGECAIYEEVYGEFLSSIVLV